MVDRITYKQVGDYLLPNIQLKNGMENESIGRYGKMRKAFLREHQPILYNKLLLTEQLFLHLHEVDDIADEKQKNGVSESLIIKEIVCEY